MNGISQAQLGTVECLKDDPARGEVGCNPTLGHHQDCQRFNPRDPKAQMRERMRGAMTGAGMGAPGMAPGMMGMPGMVPTLAAQHQMAAHQMGYGPSPYAAPSQAAYPIGIDVVGQQPHGAVPSAPQGYGAPMPQLPAGFPPGAFAGMYGHAPGALPPGSSPQAVPSATVAAVHSAVTSRSERLFQAALYLASAAFDGTDVEAGEAEEKLIKDSTRRAKLLVDGVETLESAK